MEYTVNHYPEKHRFEVVEDGLTAYVEYRLRGDALDIIHTIVPVSYTHLTLPTICSV